MENRRKSGNTLQACYLFAEEDAKREKRDISIYRLPSGKFTLIQSTGAVLYTTVTYYPSPARLGDGTIADEGLVRPDSATRTPAGFIGLTPVGCQTPKGIKRVNKAMRAVEDANAAVANAADKMMREWEEGREDEDWTELQAAIRLRRAKQEAFLRAVAGVPEEK